ncbi:MAG: cobalt ECF transporter T component CbiQ [Peptococcaceae bacterium]|nr:cobalt ECF transporter T component CbiQ [Peptococcaceae bacterium]
MKFQLDAYASLNTLLHRWEPRCKIIALMALIFAFSFVSDLRLLPAMIVVTTILFAASRLPFSFLLHRLRLPVYFLLIMAVFLPLFSGETVLVQAGPVAVKEEGCLQLLVITVRFFCILTVGIILFGTTPFLNTIKALRSLGLPFVLADMTFFSYRYLYEIGDDLKTMERAMKLRGFKGRNLGAMKTLASLAGTILVRSYEQSDRVYKAMSLRGYGQPACFRDEVKVNSRDWIGLLIVILVAAAFVGFEIVLYSPGG